MIGKLTGLVDSVAIGTAIIDVGGVGYLLSCSGRTLGRLPAPGASVSLVVETHMREDRLQLFGFVDSAERDWFRLLLSVQGVGAKVALGILSALGTDGIAQAISAGDRAAVSQADGVGPKLAGRIVAELADKAGALGAATVPGAAADNDAAGPDAASAGAVDAVSALVNLGYRRSDAFGAVSRAARDLGPEAAVAMLIRAGLKELGT